MSNETRLIRISVWTSAVLIASAITLPAHAGLSTDENYARAIAQIGALEEDKTSLTRPTAQEISTLDGNSGDIAQGRARSTFGGAVRASAQAGGAGGTVGPMYAEGIAGWEGTFRATGTGVIDLDFDFAFDGFLEAGNNNSGSDVSAQISVQVEWWNESRLSGSIFSGFARLTKPSVGPAELIASGDLSGVGTLAAASCAVFGTCYEYSVAQSVDDTLLMAPDELVTVYVNLQPAAQAPGGFESSAMSNFFDTLTVELTSDNPTASFVVANPVPLPPALLPFAAAFTALLLGRHRV